MDHAPFSHFDHVEPGHVVARADRVCLAVHEAAHVVAAHAFGIPCRSVDVAEDGGLASFNMKAAQHLPAALRILVALAGRAATATLVPDLHDTLRTSPDLLETSRLARASVAADKAGISNAFTVLGRDDDEFLVFALMYGAENPPATDAEALGLFDYAEQEARRLVQTEEWRPAIDAVAVALMQRDRLSGVEIQALIDKAAPGLRDNRAPVDGLFFQAPPSAVV